MAAVKRRPGKNEKITAETLKRTHDHNLQDVALNIDVTGLTADIKVYFIWFHLTINAFINWFFFNLICYFIYFHITLLQVFVRIMFYIFCSVTGNFFFAFYFWLIFLASKSVSILFFSSFKYVYFILCFFIILTSKGRNAAGTLCSSDEDIYF